MYKSTSLEAYFSISDIKAFSRQEVLKNLIDLGEACNQEVAQKMGWEINRITPRMNELVKMGIVEGEKKYYQKTRKNVFFWRLKNK